MKKIKVFGKARVVTLLFTILLVLGVASSVLAASTYYVRTDGDDSLCDGLTDAASTSAPNCAKKTIQAAINTASAGDTIQVAAGTYDVTSTIVIDKGLTITGPFGGGAIVQGTDSGTVSVFEIAANDVTIKDLEISHSSLPGISSPWYEVPNSLIRIPNDLALSGIVISGNTIYVPAQAGAMKTWGGVAVTVGSGGVTNISITGNTVYNTRNGIVVQTNNTATVRDNLIYNTKGGVMNYTTDQSDADNRTTSNNDWGATHNEWDIVWNTAYYVPDYQQDVLVLSINNNEAYVLDRRAADAAACAALTGNRSHIFIDDDSTIITAHPAQGNYNEPFATVALGIDAVVPGGTVYVAVGTYAERLSVTKSLTLLGAQAGVDPTQAGARTNPANESIIDITGLSVANPNVAVEIPAGVTDVTISGFTIKGSQTFHYADEAVIRTWDDRITIKENILDGFYGVLIKGNDYITVEDNRITANKVGITVQPNPATFVVMSGNVIIPGSSPAADAAAMYLAGCTDCSVLDNVASGFVNNNGVGGSNLTRLLISGNVFDGNKKGVNIWGSTTFVTVEKNTITNSSDIGVNIKGQDITIANNFITGNLTGIKIEKHTLDTQRVNVFNNDLSGNSLLALESTSAVLETINASGNWWGAPCGPGPVGPGNGDRVSLNVDYSPWWGDASGTYEVSEGSGGELVIPTGASTAQAQAVLNCAAGKAVMFESGSYDGGLVISGNGTTVKLNGCTVGHGSPAFTITADDVTILGPGLLDGDGDTSPSILVQAGADNAILQNLEIREWADGVQVAGSVESFKLIGNWIHNNTDAGLQVDSSVSIGGIVTIEGNLFKANGGNGIQNDGDTDPLDAEYNSWGDLGGPTVGSGDGVSTKVDYQPFTFAEFFMDMVPDTLATEVEVDESTDFEVALKADAASLYGLAFKISYDSTKLMFTGIDFTSDWDGKCAEIIPSTAGEIKYRCNLQAPGDLEWNADKDTLATLHFTASGSGLTGNGEWETYLDIAHAEAQTSAGAIGGIKVFVNNAGYGDPSSTDRDITDTDDGKVIITGIAKFTGYVDLQGRANDSGATLKIYAAASTGSTNLANATSSSSGKYTTAYIAPHLLTIGTNYHMNMDAYLYLPTTPLTSTTFLDSKDLVNRPLTGLNTVMLLGGDATNDEVININDASCIGGDYQQTPDVCGTDGWSDVNGDGQIDLLDLVLMGGNFDLNQSPWTP